MSYLISHNILDIKIASIKSEATLAMEHEKIGIFSDEYGNMVVFSGSGNETPYGLKHNSENFDVYCSWKGEDPYTRCFRKDDYFKKLWDGTNPAVHILTFPEAVREKIFKYKNYLSKEELEKIDKEYIEHIKKQRIMNQCQKMPYLSSTMLRDYQNDAIKELRNNKYRGYFDMATGTGKTLTALGGLSDLINNPDIKTKSFFVLIVVPSSYLIVQWAEECEKIGLNPLLAFNNSRKWKKEFSERVTSIKLSQSKIECVIITTVSLLNPFVLETLDDEKLLKRTFFIADEAHNLGANKIKKILDFDFKYRLGLSATMDRHHDKDGTDKLYNFFEKCCIHYDLERAIKEGHLSHYRYYPILVNFDENELDQYVQLSKKISKLSTFGDPDTNDALKHLLLKRALIVSGCKMKIETLKTTISPFKNEFYNIIYCGAVSYFDISDLTEETQLQNVMSVLKKDLKMKIAKFTATEDVSIRETIKEQFTTKFINGIVAIKCLDEGINIPCIQRAFILASSTNPKEYIQRRGRVLRLFDPREKPYAEIYDFITLSRPLSDLKKIDPEYIKIESSLAKRELARLKEFSRLSDNSADNYKVISDIISAYHLDEFNYEEENDYE